MVRPAVHPLYSRIAYLEMELKMREEQLRIERIRKYGPKGEKLSHEQVLLLDLDLGVQAGEVEKEAELAEADKALGEAATQKKKAKRLQSDGYEAYTALGRRLLNHAGCWAHVRRKFDEARKVAPKEVPCRHSQAVLDLIAKLYLVEKEAREQGLSDEARFAWRQQRKVADQLQTLKDRDLQIQGKLRLDRDFGDCQGG